ncbi:MAG: lipoyl(octanoyl) transferase LipB [Myxococcota bacterium]
MPQDNPQSLTSQPSQLQWCFLGEVPYRDAWALQKQLRHQRLQQEIPDTLLLLEHPPTITLGCLRGEQSLHQSPEQLRKQGLSVIISDRGGDATLHAPGQLVGYLIVNLAQRQQRLPHFVRHLASAIIRFLRRFDIDAHYDHVHPGVWIQQQKIAAFGFHLKQNITMHGFALNLHTDLALFEHITPCGIQDRGVTSLAQHIPNAPTPQQAAPILIQDLQHALHLQTQRIPASNIKP